MAGPKILPRGRGMTGRERASCSSVPATAGSSLPFLPPLSPMLARLARELPRGDFLYEPKWDGFRCLAFVHGGEVDLRSRHEKPLARYFPELVAALRTLGDSFALDGEVVIETATGFDFAALLNRTHPAA